ncbi:MAG: type II secretion system protein GspM [Brevundimonas sp.]|uniref:type II secretion system protein GspM n=1 Tax=Brevundimonas sp. TaxID=1871086 RepID=UPI002732F28E|nr:type II secretion system protein GspM [Brevundimonas sp.]MDP3658257.1 type II secretion system protein GspM [Brevundimonas sp.]MDZ4113002.1 type II secretion system protein GspM [Brevundimonas sp.]
MNRIISGLELWWSARTLRERRMLMVMAALLLATIVWLGLIRPVRVWKAEAAERAEAAAVALAEVRAAVVLITPSRPAAEPPAEGLEPLVRRTADGAGLELVTAMSGSGRLGFQLSRVRSGPLFAWLSALETDHRLAVCSLGVVKNADATLNVEGVISAEACMA